MGFLINLFAPARRCASCRNRVGPFAGTVVANRGADPFEVLKNVGMCCPRCRELVCVPCAVRAGKACGEREYHCPSCGAQIGEDHYLE
jgi:hypothetical protein